MCPPSYLAVRPGKETMKFVRVIVPLLLILAATVTVQPNKASAASMMTDLQTNPVVLSISTASIPDIYIVKSGDSLTSVSSHFHVKWQSFYCANKKIIGSNPDVLSPGERIKIPRRNITCKIVLPAPPVMSPQIIPSSAPVNQTASVTSYVPQALSSLQQYALELEGNDQQQYSCLNSIINAESSWNVTISNASSGAYGIPQALPGSKMAIAGYDWATNGYTQLKWMVDDYVNPVYGSACNAWAFHLANGYY